MNVVTLTAGGAVAEIVPERGGIITRFAVEGDEIFYLDPATLADAGKNVRGGVPILFPVAGKPPAGSPMKQHGFARNLPFRVTRQEAPALTMILEASEETLRVFPYRFALELSVEVGPRSLELSIRVTNRGDGPMPLHFGLHPYFHVGDKASARIATDAARAFDNTTGRTGDYREPDWSQGELDLHLLDQKAHRTTLKADGMRPRVIEWDGFLPTLVLWTQPAKPFLCIEPWSAPSNACQPNTAQLAAGETAGGIFRVTRSA
jgi:galactose mutarotase-like enzyme